MLKEVPKNLNGDASDVMFVPQPQKMGQTGKNVVIQKRLATVRKI
jgi:hypothetical protein